MNLLKIINEGCTIYTSGTTGPSKPIKQSAEKLYFANKAAVECQKLNKFSKVYTVCTLEHAGGLLAQTLPAIAVDADVHVESFNAFRWVKNITNYTHSHLTPNMARAVIATKTFKTLDLNGITIMCGSDRVHSSTIKAFIEQGATFIANWGMSEVGPVAINKTFNKGDIVNHTESIMGDTTYCETKVVDGELYVKGDICVYDDWFATGDLVEYKDNIYWYIGRKNA
jgi:acyl-CoA synthetase (AMP-forming)/AMP-acid ligase II